MASEVEKLLEEQKKTTGHLAFFEDVKTHVEDTLLEQMITNEELEKNTKSLSSIEKSFSSGVKQLAHAIQSLKLDVPDLPQLPEAEMLDGQNDKILSEFNGMNIATNPEIIELQKAVHKQGEMTFWQLDTANDLTRQQLQLLKDGSDAPKPASVPATEPDKPSEDGDMPDMGGISGLLGKFKKGGIKGLLKGGGKGVLKMLGKGFIVAQAAMFAKDMYDGFTDPELLKNITGKAKEELTGVERTMGAFSHGLSELTFGLVDAQSIFKGGMKTVEFLKDGANELFNTETGVMKNVGQSLSDAKNAFMNGDIVGVLAGISQAPMRLIEDAARNINDLSKEYLGIDMSGIVDPMWAALTDPIYALPGLIKDGLTAIFGDFKLPVDDIKESVMGGLGKLGSFFGIGDDDKKKAEKLKAKEGKASGIPTTGTEIVRQQLEESKAKARAASGYDPKKLGNGSDIVARQMEESRAKARAKSGYDPSKLGKGASKVERMLAESRAKARAKSGYDPSKLGNGEARVASQQADSRAKARKASGYDNTQLGQGKRKVAEMMAAQRAKVLAEHKRRAQVEAKQIDSSKTIALSKQQNERMLAKTKVEAPAPVIVQQTQTAEPKTRIIRRTSAEDMELNMINSGSLSS